MMQFDLVGSYCHSHAILLYHNVKYKVEVVIFHCFHYGPFTDLQAGIWFGSVAPSPMITFPQSPMV